MSSKQKEMENCLGKSAIYWELFDLLLKTFSDWNIINDILK